MRFRTIWFLISFALVKADLSPTGRALRALELLQAQPGITAGGLAAQLEVTERAARRYIAILREAGIPVESTRGPYGGYRLGRGIRLPPLVFTAAEALGLVMAVPDGSHAAAVADDPVGAAGLRGPARTAPGDRLGVRDQGRVRCPLR
jgi:biotin operon repressor